MTTVTSVRGKNRADLLADPAFVYVGRQCAGWSRSPFGNPYRVQRQGFRMVDGSCCRTPEEAIAKYRAWLLRNLKHLPPLETLRGKTLGCWCGDWKPGEPELLCHAVELAHLADQH